MPTEKEDRERPESMVRRDTTEIAALLTSILEEVKRQVKVEAPKPPGGADLAAVQQYRQIIALLKLEYPPDPPEHLKAVKVSARQINLVWISKNVHKLNGFKIERCDHEKCDDFVEVQRINNPRVTSYEDRNVTIDMSYRYRMRAFNITGDSIYSHVAEVRTFDGPKHKEMI
jgi:hypothetical protein